MLSAAVNSSSVRDDGQQAAEQAREALQDTLRGLPANKQVDMCVLKEAYDSSIREAAAADAAVAAVAKVCVTTLVHHRRAAHSLHLDCLKSRRQIELFRLL